MMLWHTTSGNRPADGKRRPIRRSRYNRRQPRRMGLEPLEARTLLAADPLGIVSIEASGFCRPKPVFHEKPLGAFEAHESPGERVPDVSTISGGPVPLPISDADHTLEPIVSGTVFLDFRDELGSEVLIQGDADDFWIHINVLGENGEVLDSVTEHFRHVDTVLDDGISNPRR